MARSLAFHGVSFRYETSVELLLSEVSLGLTQGWTGVVGANGSGKTTFLRLACGELRPTAGSIVSPAHAVYCPQRTDRPPQGMSELLSSHEGEAWKLRGWLGIEDDWLRRWDSLSHGERKRAQIAVALWRQPELLALDEPTNHLDRQARAMVLRALASYRGVGLLVSHDRELLDQLCGQCCFLSPPTATVRGGGYSQARGQLAQEQEALRKQYQSAQRERKRLEAEAARRGGWEAQAQRARSKRWVDPKDSDAKEKIDRARLSDGKSGGGLRQIERRVQRAREQEQELSRPKGKPMGIGAPGSASHKRLLVKLPAGRLRLGPERALRHPDLVVEPEDRIALVGENGSGKSTLVRQLIDAAKLPGRKAVYVPQEIPAGEGRRFLDEARALSGQRLGEVMDHVSRLGSDAKQLLETVMPSPGEVRKLLLALALPDAPQFIVMDEPTNHMDLPSIECLEEALAGFPGALLLVSHDERFLERLTTVRWEIGTEQAGQDQVLSVRRSKAS